MSGMSQSLLTDLTISTWDARKSDKRESDKVVRDNDAKSSKAVNVVKRLFADEPKLMRIQHTAQSIRLWHYSRTLPWSDKGVRLLPMAAFLRYKQEYNEWERKFHECVDEFVNEYPTLVSKAAFQLGDLFNRADYPSAMEVRRRFRVSLEFLPVPQSGDFRIDAQKAELDALKEQYEQRMQERLEEAAGDLWRRVHDLLARMSTQFGYDQGKPKRLHQSLYTTARELVGLLDSLNVTNDPDMISARVELEELIYDGMIEDARKHEAARTRIKAGVDAIAQKYAGKLPKAEEPEATEEVVAETTEAVIEKGDAPSALTPAEEVPAPVEQPAPAPLSAEEMVEGINLLEEDGPAFPVPTPEYDAHPEAYETAKEDDDNWF